MIKRVFCYKGHILAENLLSRIINSIVTERHCDFKILQFDVGANKSEESFLRIEIIAKEDSLLSPACADLQKFGMFEERRHEAIFKPALADRFVPDDFYIATNNRTEIFIDGEWHTVAAPKSDAVIVRQNNALACKSLRDVKKDDLVLCGDQAVRIAQSPHGVGFTFNHTHAEESAMAAANVAAMAVADILLENKATDRRSVFLSGPSSIQSGGLGALSLLARSGFLHGFLCDNAFACLDLEKQFFGTVMGVSPETGRFLVDGDRNFLRAINRVNGYGSIAQAIEAGALAGGFLYELHQKEIPYCITGGISDTGPLPDTVTDMILAQKRFSQVLDGADALIMLGSANAAIGASKLTPSWIKTITVDLNPTAIFRLTNITASHTIGIVSDTGLFLRDLVRLLHL